MALAGSSTSIVCVNGNALIAAFLLYRYISEGLHPRVVVEGFESAKTKALEVCGVAVLLEQFQPLLFSL